MSITVYVAPRATSAANCTPFEVATFAEVQILLWAWAKRRMSCWCMVYHPLHGGIVTNDGMQKMDIPPGKALAVEKEVKRLNAYTLETSLPPLLAGLG